MKLINFILNRFYILNNTEERKCIMSNSKIKQIKFELIRIH